MEKIISLNNEKIKNDAKLKDKKFRDQRNAFIIEGEKMLWEGLRFGLKFERVYVATSQIPKYSETLSAFEKNKTPIFEVSENVFEKLTDVKKNQGILAVAVQKEPSPLGKFVLLLDRLQDQGNVGALIRTAVAAGFSDVVLLDCADPFSPKSVRGSMSGIFYINIVQTNLSQFQSKMKDYAIYIADMDGENVFNFKENSEKFILCLGNEGSGISQELKNLSTKTLSIPMDKMESLNVSVSGGILMYQLKK